MKKALLFINGEPPKKIPNLKKYDLIGCTDGALNYLLKFSINLKKINFVSGDFDSIPKNNFPKKKLIHTPDQSKTDFEKALEIILKKGFSNIHIIGSSGKEMDHFLGNISTALKFHKKAQLTFFDNYSMYFIANKKSILKNVKNQKISIYPLPKIKKISTKGLNWNLKNADLAIGIQNSNRNFATQKKVQIKFKKGFALIFIHHKKES